MFPGFWRSEEPPTRRSPPTDPRSELSRLRPVLDAPVFSGAVAMKDTRAYSRRQQHEMEFANALSALHRRGSDEKRLLDAMLLAAR